MPVKTILAVCALATLSVSGAGTAIDHWNLPKVNAERIAEHSARQEAVENSLNKLVLDRLMEICAEAYDDVRDCPAWRELTKPDGFNLLGKESPRPKVGIEG